jgi:soluble lytic murein transglycosylase-like protein
MNNVRQYIFPGAILGSLVLASFGYSVMARVPIPPAEKTTAVTAAKNEASPGSQVESASAAPDPGQGEDGCRVHNSYPHSILQWCKQITRYADKNNLNPDLIAALIWQESGGNPTAYSKSGAVGLMQIMPRDGLAASFQCINGPCFASRPTISELQKPNYNIKYGTAMLSGLLQKYGNLREALMHYGPMNVGYYYADKVIGIFNSYSG